MAPTDEQIEKMRMKELKDFLQQRGFDCVGCAEKADWIQSVKQHRSAPVINNNNNNNKQQPQEETSSDKSSSSSTTSSSKASKAKEKTSSSSKPRSNSDGV